MAERRLRHVGARPTLSRAQFNLFRQMILDHCGLHVADGKRLLLENRICRRLKALGFSDFETYYEFVRTPAGERRELMNLWSVITTHETRFFREGHHFDLLREVVLPVMIENLGRRGRLRVWSAGCSTGEEVYSLAALLEHELRRYPGFSHTVLGTDIDIHSLQVARKGLYPLSCLEQIPEAMRRYFSADDEGVAVSDALRRATRFQEVNLNDLRRMRAKFDIIFCRNVIMYFHRKARPPLVAEIARLMKSEGYLFVGTSESLQTVTKALRMVKMKSWFAYRHVAAANVKGLRGEVQES